VPSSARPQQPRAMQATTGPAEQLSRGSNGRERSIRHGHDAVQGTELSKSSSRTATATAVSPRDNRSGRSRRRSRQPRRHDYEASTRRCFPQCQPTRNHNHSRPDELGLVEMHTRAVAEHRTASRPVGTTSASRRRPTSYNRVVKMKAVGSCDRVDAIDQNAECRTKIAIAANG